MSVMELYRDKYYQYACESLNSWYYRTTVKEGSNKVLIYCAAFFPFFVMKDVQKRSSDCIVVRAFWLFW